jgi:putative phage-type endonuclease
MQILKIAQGSDEWLAIRASHFTASEAPAMMGASKYMTRNDLLKQKATGITQDIDSGKQFLFDKGHAAEAAARPIIERQINEELYPVTVSNEIDGLPLLASMDGLTMDESTVWECKLYNQELEKQILNESIDPHYYWQLEQQLLVSGAFRVIFTTSDGTPLNTASFTYISQPERRAALVAGWKQFAEDLKNFQHVEVIPAAVAAPISDLPALAIEITGSVIASNLKEWKGIVTERIASINTDLQTDQDFADADKMVKFLGDGEKRIDLVKEQAQAKAADIDAVFRALDEIKASMKHKRLELDKLVTLRKEVIKTEIIQSGKDELAAHIDGLNQRLVKVQLHPIHADFAAAIKGKRNLESMRGAVSDLVAQKKIETNALADKFDANLKTLAEHDVYAFLFNDFPRLVDKAPEDLALLIKSRISDHKAAEEKRIEAEREKIRAEEVAKLERQKREADAALVRKEAEERAAMEKQEADKARAEEQKAKAQQAEIITTTPAQIDTTRSIPSTKMSAAATIDPCTDLWQKSHDEVAAMLSDLSMPELAMVRIAIGNIKKERTGEPSL